MYPNDSAEYANGRLVNTIIRHNGKAVVVGSVTKGADDSPLVIASKYIRSGKAVFDTIDNYDLTPVPLGFVNYNNGQPGVYYLARQPKRHDWRQGFRKETAAFLYGPPRWVVGEVASTIEGAFPNLDDAKTIVENFGGAVAWSREFAVDSKDSIYHRFYGKVGNFIDKSKNFLLDNKFFWVEEALKEAVK